MYMPTPCKTPYKKDMHTRKVILLLLLGALLAAFIAADAGQYLHLQALKSHQAALHQHYTQQPLVAIAAFALVYIAVTALSLPGAALLTLLAGALFGIWVGTLLVSFASSIGATLAFLCSRFLLRDWVQNRFADRLKAINQGVEKDGAFYLFSLRLLPIFPFFIVNLLMGLTPIRTGVFYAVSQIGMLAGTLVYVNAGTQLAQLESLSGILSPALLGSFILLGLFPFIVKKIMEFVNARRQSAQQIH